MIKYEIPQKASTVVLLKITTKWPHKVLLLKRSENAVFLPGAYVFPGGRVEQSDEDFGRFLLTDNESIKRFRRFFNVDDSIIASYVAAAIRETFEETGISILTTKPNQVMSKNELGRLLERPLEEKRQPCLESLWPISWWITPKGETRRFDTWFFLCLLPDSKANDDEEIPVGEACDVLWLMPKEALSAHDKKLIFLAPPTRAILQRMANTTNLEHFLLHVDEPLFPIKPYFVDNEYGKKMLVLPGDPLHEERKKPLMLMSTRYDFL